MNWIDPIEEANGVLRDMAVRELEFINFLLSKQMVSGPWSAGTLALMNLIRACIHFAPVDLMLEALLEARECYKLASAGQHFELDVLADIARTALEVRK